ncbi:MAG TPA: RluA family pseudouridine synthase [Patescibacteria group bacterium]|nr:RluA family pseudouridine synthase [Patescibacteria group bacterium]
MNIHILYEDEDILVLDKPAGITVNKSQTTKDEITVQDFLEKKLNINSEKYLDKDVSDFYKRAGIVHRLDKETSGALIVAKNQESFENLQAQFKAREVKKTYLALAHGTIFPEKGEIKAPVGRLPWNRKRFGILAGGRDSITKYQVISVFKSKRLKSNESLTLVELYPETGRTHQIRVHLKYINNPIFSDYLYAGRKTSREDRKYLARVFLHALRISFHHPISNKVLTIESPLSIELQKTLDDLK